MALIIANAKFLNSEVELTNAYVRVNFMALPNGIDMMVNLMCYENKPNYTLNKVVSLQIPSSIKVTCGEGQQQDLSVAHTLCKTVLEEQGYTVTIDL